MNLAQPPISTSKAILSHFEALPFQDHLVLFHQKSRELALLNPTGRMIWERLFVGDTAESIAADLVTRFAVDRDTALRDTNQVIEQCLSLADKVEPPIATSTRHSFHHSAAAQRVEQEPANSRYIKLAGQIFELHDIASGIDGQLDSLIGHLEIPKEKPDHSFSCLREKDRWMLLIDGRVHTQTEDPQYLLQVLLYELVEYAYQGRDWLAVLHAAAVGRHDRALLLTGPAGSGKSTLAATLQGEGWTYLSDDVSLLDRRSGRLLPMPVCQAIKPGSWEVLERRYPNLRDCAEIKRGDQYVRYLSPRTGSMEQWSRLWEVNALVFVRYEKGAGSTLQQISPLQVLTELLLSKNLRAMNGFGGDVRTILEWIERIPGYVLHYGEENQALRALNSLNVRERRKT